MSQYTHFFIRTPHNELLLIDTVSSSAMIHEYLAAPWDKIEPLTRASANYVRDALVGERDNYTNILRNYDKDIEFVQNCRGTDITDRLEARGTILAQKADAQLVYEEIVQWIHFMEFLLQIMESAANFYSDLSYTIDPDRYIYFGTECGFNPEIPLD